MFNIQKRELENNINMHCCCACLYGTGIWLVHYLMGLLFFFDFNERKITCIEEIPINTFFTSASFFSMLAVKGSLYMIPNNADAIYKYIIHEKKFEKIELKETSMGLFRDAFVWKNEIICIPNLSRDILWLNWKNKQTNYYRVEEKIDCGCIQAVERKTNLVYMTKGDAILTYNFENMICSEWYTENNARFEAICLIRDIVVAYNGMNQKIVSIRNGQKEMVIDFPHGDIKLVNVFDKYILVESVNTISWWLLDIRLNIIKNGEKNNLYLNNGWGEKYYYGLWILEKEHLYEVTIDGVINVYDSKGGKATYKMKINSRWTKKIRQKMFVDFTDNRQVIKESNMISLIDMLVLMGEKK